MSAEFAKVKSDVTKAAADLRSAMSELNSACQVTPKEELEKIVYKVEKSFDAWIKATKGISWWGEKIDEVSAAKDRVIRTAVIIKTLSESYVETAKGVNNKSRTLAELTDEWNQVLKGLSRVDVLLDDAFKASK
eukprot:TRINITY_DN86_c0_g1_i1.p1 TRINITY_DN86_c0_g1~~TRINITY_DN86_c0_g1_i1.p1  ORF type:complete len:134 (-),score=0.71 TRINITY_DN86_c0_g1_i1:58-459(-)